jgi:hypothetical protein
VSEQAGRYQRSAMGMVGAMIVLVAVIVGFVVLRDLNRSDPPSPVRAVDYQQTARVAQEQAQFELLVPEPLPQGWRVTSVEFDPATSRWHLGQLTDADKYVGLEQSLAEPDSLVEEYVDPAARRAGTTTVAGERWAVWTDDGGDTALVRRADGVTTLVVGTIGQEGLEDYLTTLR